MRTFNLILSVLFIFNLVESQNVFWAKKGGGDSPDYGYATVSDASGNVYVAGCFTGTTATFDQTVLTNNGPSNYSDIFIAKYNTNGNLLWVLSFGGERSDEATKLAIDNNNNLIVAGSFKSSQISFGSYNFSNVNLSNEIFLLKISPDGNLIWAKKFGNEGVDEPKYCTVDNNNNIVLVGKFGSSSLTFDNITINNNLQGYDDIFVAKFDANGNTLWAKNFGGTRADVSLGCSCDNNGNVYITGWCTSDQFSFDNFQFTNSGYYSAEMFVCKLNGSNGSVIWAKKIGGAGMDKGVVCLNDNSNNLVVVGYSGSYSLTFENYTFNSAGILLLKYNSNGNLLWAKNFNTPGGSQEVYCASLDQSGNIFLGGFFQGDTMRFDNVKLINAGNSDIFVAKLDPDGVVKGAISFGSDNEEWIYGLSERNTELFITGYFLSSSLTFENYTLINGGYYDIFVAKINGNLNNNNPSDTTENQIAWYEQFAPSGVKYLRQASFVDSLTGWAVAGWYPAQIIKTTNGGQTWSLIYTNQNQILKDIYFVDANNGWVVGNDGLIMHTTNGGNNWTVQTSNTTQTLYSVYFINSQEGWACGNAGTLLHTTNGGNTWVQQTLNISERLNSIFFYDQNNGAIAADFGYILTTHDGGQTWASFQDLGKGSKKIPSFNDVEMLSPNKIIAVGSYSSLDISEDGGNTWAEYTLPSDDITAIAFYDSQHGYLVDISANIFKTFDGGYTWHLLNTDTLLQGAVELLDVVTTDANNVWVFGGFIMTDQAPKILHSNSGGGTPVIITQIYNDKVFNVYPNPCSDIVNIEFNENKSEIIVNIFSILGNCVYSSRYNNVNFIEIPLYNLKQGFYFMSIKDNTNRNVLVKLVKN